MKQSKYQNLNIGDSYSLKKEITPEMVRTFADFTGDYNPVHMDDTFCKVHGMESRIVHGMLILSFLSTVIGMHLPGEGSVWLSQNIDFVTPARIGDTVTITAEVIGKDNDNALKLNKVQMKITVTNQLGAKVARGTVKVLIKE